MKGIKDWVFSQLVSSSLISSRPMSGNDGFFDEERLDEGFSSQVRHSNEVAHPTSTDPTRAFNGNLENQLRSLSQPVQVEDSHQSNLHSIKNKLDPLAKIEDLQIKFLRLLRRLGWSHDNLVAAKVFYRLHLASLIRAGESGMEIADLSERAREIAAGQEAANFPVLDFSMRILVLGKTGVGKSATINSIFNQTKVTTNAFHPATDHIQEVIGIVNGIRITVIDTPGLLPFSHNLRRNRKILHSVKKFIRKSPPDIVLYFERLDLMGYGDLPLLKLITDVFGSTIWFNTIPVMTHSCSSLPEGTNGYPVSYDFYVSHCADLMQKFIQQAVSDSRLENPLLLVENHPQCKTNIKGEKVLPDGQAWKSQFLLLCACTKVLNDANALLGFQDSVALGPVKNVRLPSLPHLLSSFLQRHPLSNTSGVGHEISDALMSEIEEDEYDQLPPIRILTKSQFQKLTNSQKEDYLDELDYRETLYLKKQLKEEFRKRKESECSTKESVVNDGISDNPDSSPDPVPLTDMAIPPSFDSNCPVHRYRCLLTTDQWLVRPVFDPHGWDHDVGFDGINLEAATEIKKNVLMSGTGQLSKEKQDFSFQSECAAVYASSQGPNYCVGVDVQSAGQDLIYTIHNSTKFRNLLQSVTECGVSVTSVGGKFYTGAKLENAVSVGKRLELIMNAGRMSGQEQVAHGGTLRATLRGRDYPVRNDSISLALTVLFFNKETVFSGNIETEFRPIRGTRISVNGNVNNQSMGQICIKTSSSERLEIAVMALVSIFSALLRRKTVN